MRNLTDPSSSGLTSPDFCTRRDAFIGCTNDGCPISLRLLGMAAFNFGTVCKLEGVPIEEVMHQLKELATLMDGVGRPLMA